MLEQKSKLYRRHMRIKNLILKKITKLRLIENIRLKNSNLDETKRFDAVELAQKMLNIDNVIITVISSDDDKN